MEREVVPQQIESRERTVDRWKVGVDDFVDRLRARQVLETMVAQVP